MTTIPPNPAEALVTISTPQRDTVRVRDRVESSRFEFYFDKDVEIEPTPTENFYFPVDIAAKFSGSWSETKLPMATGALVHDHSSGQVIDRVGQERPEIQLHSGEYEITPNPAPAKIYIFVDTRVTLRFADDQMSLLIPENESVILGVRSLHDHPAGTITTTGDIRNLMKAVSHLGSALKTTSPERSWPTLRGQPPNIDLGDELEIPPALTKPDVDVQIEIPPNPRAVFNIAPLAYYTSAEVIQLPWNRHVPALVAAGERIPLEGDLATAAGFQLKRNVLLDSVVRSVGIYPFITNERRAVEDELPWGLETVYDLPLGERIAEYQKIENEVIEGIWPSWPLTIDITGTREDISMIPFLAEELAVVRTPDSKEETPQSPPSFVEDFIRADGAGNTSASRTSEQNPELRDVWSPDDHNTQLHTSLREGYPLGSNKTSIRAYRRHIQRETPEDHAIEVKVVCNDDEMREEDVVSEFYGLRDLLEFEISVHYNLTTSEFTELLSASYDLIHYIGHVDEEGFKCQDGYVDARADISEVGFDVFLLNACRSVEQGEALLDAGAEGGIATLYEVPNSSATKLGRALSRLLNRGFTVRSALEIGRESSFLGDRWVSLGDGRVSLTQSESGVTFLPIVTPINDSYKLELKTFETESRRIGSLVDLNVDWLEPYVVPGGIESELTANQLDELFSLEAVPVMCRGQLLWTDEVSPTDLREL